jgi:hypothetical protein
MKLQLNPSTATQTTSGGLPGKLQEAVAKPGDGIEISNVFAALDQGAKISRIAAAVQAGSYRISSSATGNAILEDALFGRN